MQDFTHVVHLLHNKEFIYKNIPIWRTLINIFNVI